MIHKKASKSYYFKPTRIIGEYILACLFCMVYEAVQEGGSVFNITKEFFLRILGILSFESARYGWYVEMYIGLFLLIPYLNILYNNLQDKRSKQGLILTLLLLSGIPAVGNSLCFHIPWTMRYNDPSDFLKTLPSWWEMFYPVTYYMIGAYLSEYPLNLSKAKIGALTLIATLFVGTFNYLTNADKEFIYISFNIYESLFTVVQAVLVFSFFLKLDLQKMGPGVQKLLSHISGLCFCAYLVSYVFNRIFYPIFTGDKGLLIHRPQYFFVLVPIVMSCSLATSLVLVSLNKSLDKICRKCIGAKQSKNRAL